jgi:hypothetical protein
MFGSIKLNLLWAVLAATFASAWAQSDSWFHPKFEVASIRPSKPDTPSTFGVGNGEGGGTNVTLKTLIAFAYGLQQYQILEGPGWISSDRFDIQARAADPKTPPDRLRLMLQSLFADRFKLAVHRETKLSNVYVLVVAKGGPKITLSADQNAAPISRLAHLLSQRLDRTVIDKTNLTGRFDIRLQWTPDVGENPLSPAGDPLPISTQDAPVVFAAIQEQLGLRLKPGKELVEFLIVDHVEKPPEN